MKLIPNIGPASRIIYIILGLSLVLLALWAPFLSAPLAVIVFVLGAAGVVEGAIGF